MPRISPVDLCPFCDEAPCQCAKQAKAAAKPAPKPRKKAAPKRPVADATQAGQADTPAPDKRPAVTATGPAIDRQTDPDDPPEPSFADVQAHEEDMLLQRAVQCFVDAGMATVETPRQRAARWRADRLKESL